MSFQQASASDVQQDDLSFGHRNGGGGDGQFNQQNGGIVPKVHGGQSLRPAVRSAVAGSRPKSGRPKSSVR